MSDIDLGVEPMSSYTGLNSGLNSELNVGLNFGDRINSLIGSPRWLLTRGQAAIVALILSVGVTSTATAIQLPALGLPEPISNDLVTVAPTTSRASLPNGTYLYGQAPLGGQMGQEYVVFEVRQGQVVGAFYTPNSEFSCFQGVLENNQMNVTVASTYDNSSLAYQLAQEQPRNLAAVGDGALIEGLNSITYPHRVGLEDFHPISSITANDQQLLATCQAKYQ
jgi:hypothetical protein